MNPRRKLTPFLAKLRTLCQERLIDEKWLLAPSLRVGQQWLDSLTLSGASVVNCRLFTVPGMAIRLASQIMNQQGFSFCNEKTQLFIVDSILSGLTPSSSKYFSRLLLGLSLSKKVCAMLNALELAGLEPDDIKSAHFESSAKYEDIVLIFREYKKRLLEMNLVDYSDVLKIALESVGSNPSKTLKAPALFLVPAELELHELERRLFRALASDKVIEIGEGDAASDFLDQRRAEQERINAALGILMASDPTRKIAFYEAVGPANEIKGVLRRCAAENIAFDDVEIVHTDADSYVSAIYETVLAAYPKPLFDWSGLPATFAEGVSAGFSRPARALQGWIEWMRTDFPQALLVHLVEEGLLNLGDDYADDSHFRQFGQMLRKLVVVNGRARYLPALRARLDSIGVATHGGREITYAVEQGGSSGDVSSDWQALYDFVERLLAISRYEGLSISDLLSNVRTFVSKFALCVNEMDNYARLAIVQELDSLSEWLSHESFSFTFDALEWARNIPNSLRILGSGPRPGCLHVSHIMGGGYSGRKYLFIVGLDEERFPGSAVIDPLLLDHERQEISDRLPTSWKTHEQKLAAFVRLLARQTGDISLSYSNGEVSEDASYLPSSMFQAVWNFFHPDASDDSVGRYRGLTCAAFAPLRGESPCAKSEWWFKRILANRPPAKEPLFRNFFPHLWRGLRASEARATDAFTEYDGNVPPSAGVFDPTSPTGPILSVQKLETFAKCPLSYFFRYVLLVTPPDEPGMQGEEWLDALEMGSLLHEVFRSFIQELMTQGRTPVVERDRPRLHSILQQRVDESKIAHPPPSMRAFYRQLRLLEAAADIFLVEEQIASRSLTPRFVEVSIGLRRSGAETNLDQEAPENIEIEPGVFIRIQGKVDRIDESVEGAGKEFIVWDYKTGGTYRYQRPDLFHQGRNLQHAIYTALVAALLKKRLDPKSRVSKFGYYFPSLKGRGARIITVQDGAGDMIEIVKGLCRMMSRGCFPGTTDDKEDCVFCDYAEVCRDVEATAAQSVRKVSNNSNTVLMDFRLIRGIG